jgi:hypothetical protein
VEAHVIHVHVYKVIGMREIDVDTDSPIEARSRALETEFKVLYPPDCKYIALTLEGNDENKYRA